MKITREYAIALLVMGCLQISAVTVHAFPLAYTDARVASGLQPVVATGSGVYYPSGTYFFGETDLRVAARGFPMVWDRHYRSNRVVLNAQGQWNFALPVDGPLGYGWHNTWLCRMENDSFKTANGLYIHFDKDSAGNYLPNSAAGFTLRKTAAGYEIVESGGMTYVFDTQGKLTAVRDSAGNSATLSYGADGKLASISDVKGRQIFTMSYNAAGHIASVTDLAGRVVSYDYDSFGNQTQVRYGGVVAANYTSNANHGMTGKANAIGESYTILYNPKWEDKGVVQKVTDPAGNSSTFSYDFTNHVYYNTDYSGVTYRYYLNAAGKLLQSDEVQSDGTIVPQSKIEYQPGRITKTTDAMGNVTLTQSDEWGNTIRFTDADGNVWSNSYDTSQRLISSTDPLGTITKFEYDANGNRTKLTEAAGTADESITTYGYSSYRELVSTTQYGSITVNSYDDAGNLIEITDPLGNKTTMTYDAVGNLLSRTEPLIGAITFESYDYQGNFGKITDPNGNSITYTYDLLGRVKTGTNQADGGVTQYGFVTTGSGGSCTSCGSGGGTGKLASIIMPEGNKISYDYNNAGKLVKITDNDGNTINFTYDSRGNKIKEEIKDTSGVLQKTLSSQYDLFKRITQNTNPDNSFTAYGFNKRGNLASIKNPNGNTTTYAYDAINRLTTVNQPGNVTTTFTYDRRNNLTGVTDANGNTTSYEYDKLNQLTKTTSPDTGITIDTYDGNGNLKTQIDAKGVTLNYTYDAANRLTAITFPDPSDNVTYAYDTCANGKGKICTMTDPSGTTTYEYTKKGNLAKETKTIDSQSFVTEYGYDRNGNNTTLKYPSGRIVTYNYANDRVTGILNNGTALASNIAYKPFGGIASLTFGNGIQQATTYDNQYRIGSITATGVQNLTYGYDANGNITGITDNLDNAKSKSYGYDALDRLSTATGPWGGLGYTYDRMGNRRTESHNSVATTYGYKPNTNQLTSVTGEKSYTFAFDANGNTSQENSRSYIYNQNQRMIKVTEQNGEITTTKGEYIYNGNGQRTKKTVDGQVNYFIFDQQEKMIDEAGTTSADYVFLNGTPYAKAEGVTIYFYHNNHLGTPLKMTDATKAVVWEISAMPFGETLNITGTATSNLRFPGQYNDQETGLSYNYLRDFNSLIGRYVESDPIGINRGENPLYIYVKNNPDLFTDPFGLYVGGIGFGCGGSYNNGAISGDYSHVWDSHGNSGTLVCGGAGWGYGKGKGGYCGLSTTHMWGVNTICDMDGMSLGFSVGYGAGPAINVSGTTGSGVNVNTGVGFGKWGRFAGGGGCKLLDCDGPCCKPKPKCKEPKGFRNYKQN